MKSFFSKHKRLIFLIAALLVITFICTTAAVTSSDNFAGSIDDISTCSAPEGKIVAHGIDVSFYQEDIDFEAIKNNGYDFVIIRAGISGDGVDSRFEEYYQNALSAGLDIGCYYYTYSTTVDGVLEDAENLLEIIDGKSFNYPVFLDFEFEELLSYDRVDANTAMINAYCDKIKRSGYYPGVYTSSSVYNNYIESDTLGNTWDFWVASYDDHTYESDEYNESFSMWQYSDSGTISGIMGNVDLDVSYVDYPSVTNEFKDKILRCSDNS